MTIRWNEISSHIINPNRVDGGAQARQRGEIAEEEFDRSARQYVNFGRISWHETHAKFVEVGRTKIKRRAQWRAFVYGYWEKQGEADRLAVLPPTGGSCWIEIKSAQSKTKDPNRFLLYHGLHQYENMLRATHVGALAFYALRWLDADGRLMEWRLHPVERLERDEKKIIFIRQDGLLAKMETNGLPEWLPAVESYQTEKTTT